MDQQDGDPQRITTETQVCQHGKKTQLYINHESRVASLALD